jgi:hypothetical protein
MTEISPETERRLQWHAGFAEIEDASAKSISACTWPANNLGSELEHAVRDFLMVLEDLNHELNGEVPSETASRSETIPTRIAYAVAEVIRQLRDYGDKQGNSIRVGTGSREAWLVETAWLAVLAGDIDDVLEHVEGEEAARRA